MEKENWNNEAKIILRREMKNLNLTYQGLSDLFTTAGFSETPENLKLKINRAGFSAGFFVQCLSVMSVGYPKIPNLEEVLQK